MSIIDYIKEEYKNYGGDTKTKLIELALSYAELGLLDEYKFYLKRHFNNAFSDKADVEEEVSAMVIANKLSGEAREVLSQIVESPKFDGDVVSKVGKSELFSHKLILRIANNKQFGDNAANSLGYAVWKELHK